jgi:hypothetical protein
MMHRALALLSVMLTLAGSATLAAAPPSAGSLLPPGALGPNWALIGASQIDPAQAPFASTASAMYGGPAGSRVFVRVFVAAPGSSAARQTWDAAEQAFAGLRSLVRESTAVGGSVVADRPAPAGCAEARRAEGQDASFPDFPAGLTLCEADLDLVVLVGVFGTIDGRTGSQASDAVLATILRGRGAATPTT